MAFQKTVIVKLKNKLDSFTDSSNSFFINRNEEKETIRTIAINKAIKDGLLIIVE